MRSLCEVNNPAKVRIFGIDCPHMVLYKWHFWSSLKRPFTKFPYLEAIEQRPEWSASEPV